MAVAVDLNMAVAAANTVVDFAAVRRAKNWLTVEYCD
jgi:hypothetical protein